MARKVKFCFPQKYEGCDSANCVCRISFWSISLKLSPFEADPKVDPLNLFYDMTETAKWLGHNESENNDLNDNTFMFSSRKKLA